MALIKNSDRPLPGNGGWLIDLFDTDRFLNPEFFRSQAFPLINIKETEKTFDIEVVSPGFVKDDFDIATENGVLTIRAEKELDDEQSDETYMRREFSHRSFTRSFTLPESANAGDISAKYLDGILRVYIAKKVVDPVKLSRNIEVK